MNNNCFGVHEEENEQPTYRRGNLGGDRLIKRKRKNTVLENKSKSIVLKAYREEIEESTLKRKIQPDRNENKMCKKSLQWLENLKNLNLVSRMTLMQRKENEGRTY